DVPPVTARRQPEDATGPLPARGQAELVDLRPGRVDALRAAEELHVVVAGTADGSPAESWLCGGEGHIGRLPQRQDLQQTGERADLGSVACLVERSQGIDVLDAGTDLRVGESACGGAALEHRRTRFPAPNLAVDDEAVGWAGRGPLQGMAGVRALFLDSA